MKRIHQLLPDLVYGDAISNHAIWIKRILRAWGYASEIYAVRCYDSRVVKEARIFDPDSVLREDGLLYHHSIGCELESFLVGHPGPKCLIYHNITPASYFEPYRPDFARKLRDGREHLRTMAPHFSVSVGDSAYNARELAKMGFAMPGILPIGVSPEKWESPPDEGVMRALNDGKTNILFVGRIIPNKCIHHLVEAFSAYLSMDPHARLILVGEDLPDDPYCAHVRDIIQREGLREHVLVTGKVSDAQLQAYYRSAHIFWSMSEHEGFCVPLIEAMWFDVPVLAYKSTAVPETLGKGGIMFTQKDDLASVAGLAKLLVRDETLKAAVLWAQRKRRTDFLPERIWPHLNDLIRRMGGAAGSTFS